jgi:MFS transporter, putative metabolite:H+ symporter
VATAETRALAAPTADTIANRIDRLPFLPFHLRIAGILGTGTMFDAFDSLSMGAALTMMGASFALGFKTGGYLISAAFAGQFVGAILFGYVGERIGRKWAFVIALAIFGLLSIAAALAASLNEIILARLIQGVGLGAEVPVAAALFTEFVRGSARGLFIMVYESVFVWGIFLAPVAGLACLSLFGPAVGWRVLFGLGGIPMLVALIAAWKLPESPRWLAHKGRLVEADAIVARMEEDAHRLGRPFHPSKPLTVAPAGTRFGELFHGIYAKRTFVVWSMWFCSYFCSNGFQSWAPTIYMKIGGLPASRAIMLQILTGAIQLITCYTVASTVDRAGRVPWFSGGFALSAFGAALGLLLTGAFGARGWPALLLCGVIMQIGTGVNGLGVYLYTPELYPTRMRAWATSTGSSLNRLGSFIAPSIVGWMLAGYGGIPLMFAMFTAVSLFGAIVLWRLGEETKRRALEELSP